MRRRLARAALLALLGAIIALAWPLEPLPEAAPTPRVLDRNDQIIAELPGPGTRVGEPMVELPELLERALLAAEDHRFHGHVGVDPIGIARAFVANVQAGEIVQGGSTITQQLVRTVWARPSGWRGKLWEAWTALRLERRLDKDAILVEYANRVYFGHMAWGVDAAAQTYFDKDPAHLSLAEAALLAALPRRPSELDPWTAPDAALEARSRVLDRIEALDWASADELTVARDEPIALRVELPYGHAPHFVRTLDLQPGDNRTTLDLDLQLEVEGIVASALRDLQNRNVAHAAVLVVDRETAQILAYVGSASWDAEDGQVDGVRARRSPGSALKPFVYWLGLESEAITLATLIDDTPGSWSTSHGTWSPTNYDESWYGPTRARVALASSRNLPAVRVLELVGVAELHRRLSDLGLTTLTERPDHYGLALSLGDAEVRLDELVAAYLALASEGRVRRLRARPGGQRDGARVGSAPAADLVLDALDDPDARAPAFGVDSVLEPDFPLSAKTGTSVGWRDNWAMGVTTDVVVGVWVGNFDGSPMVNISGITGAGPILRQVVEIVHSAKPAPHRHADVVEGPICPRTGLRRGADCPNTVLERFVRGTAPTEVCDHDAGHTARLISPEHGTTWYVEDSRPRAQQAIALRALAPTGSAVRWELDGERIAEGTEARWVPVSGAHTVALYVDDALVDRASIHVGP